MKNAVHTRRMGSRIIALSMTLMLLFGLSCPAASAESFLSSHKDEIADIIVQVRSNLETLGDDLAAIQEAVRARENEKTSGETAGDTAGETAPEQEGGTGETVPDIGLVDVGVSDVHDNDTDVNVHHDITVNVDTSRFNNNTIIRIRESTPRAPVTPSSSGVTTTTAPKTGDLNNLVLWIVIVAVSALALAAALFFLLRKKKKK